MRRPGSVEMIESRIVINCLQTGFGGLLSQIIGQFAVAIFFFFLSLHFLLSSLIYFYSIAHVGNIQVKNRTETQPRMLREEDLVQSSAPGPPSIFMALRTHVLASGGETCQVQGIWQL